MKGRFASIALILTLSAAKAWAQNPSSLATVRARVEPASVASGGRFTLHVAVTLDPAYHVNAHVPSEDYLIPTEVKVAPAAALSFGSFRYPAPASKKFSFSEKPLAVYQGTFDIDAEATVARDAPPGPLPVSGTLQFQACNDKQCLAPASVPFQASLAVTGIPAAGADRPAGGRTSSGSPDFGAFLGEKGFLATLLLLFVGGLALNLTPCVYPVIPITIGFFGGQSGGESRRPLGLAALYVLGMAITYSVLGVLAALSGKLFGVALQSGWVLGGISLVMVALALSMFGLYDIQPPRFLMNRAGARTGAGGAFGMGLLVGIVAAPCLGPFVLGLLTYVAARRDPVLGFVLFFVLSLGLGLPYLFLALFSGTISRLPRAGVWMVEIKKIFGFVLLAMGAYFARILVSEPVKSWMLPAVLAIGGFYVLSRTIAARTPGLARLVSGAAGVLFLAAAVHFAPRPAPESGSRLAFARYDAAAVAAAGRPAMIDFSADWCIPCHELEDQTFADGRVRRALAGRSLYKADMTQQSSPEAQVLAKKFGILGMPTIVFLDEKGGEIPGSRLVGFEGPDDFLRRLAKLKG